MMLPDMSPLQWALEEHGQEEVVELFMFKG